MAKDAVNAPLLGRCEGIQVAYEKVSQEKIARH